MLVGKAIQGMKIVKQFFPEAKMMDGDLPTKPVLAALGELADVKDATAKDVVRVFDSYGLGVYNGVQIR